MYVVLCYAYTSVGAEESEVVSVRGPFQSHAEATAYIKANESKWEKEFRGWHCAVTDDISI